MNQYITTEEAVEFSKQTTVAELDAAKDIYDLYCQSNKQITDSSWFFYNAIAAVYNAGRVAGIREERDRRHMKR